MRRSKALARARAGKTVRICNLGHFIPGFVCHAAKAGFDCIWLDLEHRAMPDRDVQALLAYAHLYDIDIMVRPPTTEPTRLYRYLEDGAAGLMVPLVSTPEKARTLVEAVKFPPLGNRGIDNAGFDSDFLSHAVEDYVTWASQETFLCVQIETPEAVNNAEAIAGTEGVDMVFIGSVDLGFRLSQEGDMTLDDAWEAVAEACRTHGKPFGAPLLDADERARRHAQGARVIVSCGEFVSWADALKTASEQFDALD